MVQQPKFKDKYKKFIEFNDQNRKTVDTLLLNKDEKS